MTAISYIFLTESRAESYAKQGVRGAGHMPLAVDTDIFAEAINNAFGNVVNNVTNNVGNSCISDVAVNERAEFKDTGILQESILCNNNVLPTYACDVAFVGKLYRSDYQYISKYQDEYTRGYLEGIVSTQEKIYGGYIIDDCVNDNIMKCINDNFAKVSVELILLLSRRLLMRLQLRLRGESVIRHLRCCRTGAGLIFIQLIRMTGCRT